MKPFEIFRSGKHVSSNGDAFEFSDADVAAIAAGYDPAKHHAPIVVGHPKADAPAYGWVDGLDVVDGKLIAKPAGIDTAFAELVKGGKFRKVSAAFYPPDSASNPKPGAYYLRHVGFLGAQPPAVKGLKPVEFGDAGDVVEIAFADAPVSGWRISWAFDAAARLFRGLREQTIARDGVDAADKAFPEYEIDELGRAAADIRAEADRLKPATAFSEPPKETDMTDRTAADALAARERQIAEREAAFAERERQTRTADDAAFVEATVKAGRLPIGLQPVATALFAGLAEGEVEFADGDAKAKLAPRTALRKLLDGLPKPVKTGEIVKGDEPDFSDPAQVSAAITSEIAAAEKRGEALSPAAAAGRITRSKA